MFWKAFRRLGILGAPLAVLLMTESAAFAQVGCDTGCKLPCPPAFRHILEGFPNISFKRGCPKPICPPCELERWGYHETCWRRWPWPPNWSHCPVPPPGAYFDGTIPPPVHTPGSIHMPNVVPPHNGLPQPPIPSKLSMDTPPRR